MALGAISVPQGLSAFGMLLTVAVASRGILADLDTIADDTLTNWNHSFNTTPAIVVEVQSIADVQQIVKDAALYPSPVIALGSIHSVTACIVNNGGTIISTKAMNAIVGLASRQDQLLAGYVNQVVRVQAGVKLLQLHQWLDAQGLELSFCPEIGDATVGGLVTSTSKDSSVAGPGYLAALVATLTFINHLGDAVTLDRAAQPDALEDFLSGYSTQGIVVEATLVVRPRRLVRTLISLLPSDNTLPATLLQMRMATNNLWASISLDGSAEVEQRDLAAASRSPSPAGVLQLVKGLRYQSFLDGTAGGGLGLGAGAGSPFELVNYRWQLVNTYPPVTDVQPRLDFSYFEYPNISSFETVIASILQFARQHQAATGFQPGGFALYFVDRNGQRKSPLANYGGAAGWSFVFDPVYGNPSDPGWMKFCQAILPVAMSLGAWVSATQTKQLTSDLVLQLPLAVAQQRFMTPYFHQFTAAKL